MDCVEWPDVEEWLKVQQMVVHPDGLKATPQRLRPGPMLTKQCESVNADLLKVVEWYNHVGDIRELVGRQRDLAKHGSAVAEREKITLFAQLKKDAREGSEKKLSSDAAEEFARSHPDYAAACEIMLARDRDVIELDVEVRRLANLYSSLDKRIEALRTISANMRQSQASYA